MEANSETSEWKGEQRTLANTIIYMVRSSPMLLFTQLTNPNVQTQMYANSRATTSRDYIHARDIAKQEQVQDIMQRALGNQLVSGIMFSHQENRYTHGLDHRSCSSYKQAEARKQKLAA